MATDYSLLDTLTEEERTQFGGTCGCAERMDKALLARGYSLKWQALVNGDEWKVTDNHRTLYVPIIEIERASTKRGERPVITPKFCPWCGEPMELPALPEKEPPND